MSLLPDLTGGACHGGREDAGGGCGVHGAAEGLRQRAAAAANPYGHPQKVSQEAVEMFIHDCKHLIIPARSVAHCKHELADSIGVCTASEFLFFFLIFLQRGTAPARVRGSSAADDGRHDHQAHPWQRGLSGRRPGLQRRRRLDFPTEGERIS